MDSSACGGEQHIPLGLHSSCPKAYGGVLVELSTEVMCRGTVASTCTNPSVSQALLC